MRNIVYYVCGLTMLVCMVIAGIRSRQGHPIFWLESVALEAFAVSWLVKGRVHWTAKQLLHRARRPVTFAKHVVRTARQAAAGAAVEPRTAVV